MNGNPGKLFKAINQVVSKRKQTLLVSCCDLACMSMCASENVIPSALVMWNPGCGVEVDSKITQIHYHTFLVSSKSLL